MSFTNLKKFRKKVEQKIFKMDLKIEQFCEMEEMLAINWKNSFRINFETLK